MSFPFSKLGFRIHHHLQLQFNYRYFCSSAHSRVTAIDDPRLILYHVREQCELGFHNLQIPINLFNQMMSLPRRPSIIDFNQLLTVMLKHKQLQPHATVISLYSQLDLSGIRPDLHSIGMLANCYCYLGRVDFGFSLLAKSLKLGYPFQSYLILITTLINGLIRKTRLPDAVKLLDVAVTKFGIQPSIVTYGTMVKGLCGIGDNAGALHLLCQMKTCPSGCKPNIVVYSTLIDSLCKCKLVNEALVLFSIMKTEGIKPDVFTYTSLIRGMFNLGLKGEAKYILVEMLANNVAPDVVTFSMLVDMHSKDNMINEAEALLPIMIKQGLSPDVYTYSALIKGYCLCGQMDKARDIMDLMVQNNCQPNVASYSTLIKGFVKLQRIDKALDVLHEMREHGIAPDVVVYYILIGSLRQAGYVQEAENLVSDLLSRGLVPSRTYNILSKTNVESPIVTPKSQTN